MNLFRSIYKSFELVIALYTDESLSGMKNNGIRIEGMVINLIKNPCGL